MTTFDRIERRMPELLDELATPRMPDYLDDLLAQAAATRQRAGWTFPERWLPMSVLSQRLATVPRIPWRLGVAVALLIVAALVGLLIAGSLNPRLAPPFGPAANGRIAFLDEAGAILAGDPKAGTSVVIVPGPGNSRPAFSPDGARLAYLHSAGGRADLVVATAAGANPVAVNEDPLRGVRFIAWAPSGREIAVLVEPGLLLLFDAARTAVPTVVSDRLPVRFISVGNGDFNNDPANLFRPPTGSEILFTAGSTNVSLMVSKLDGSESRTIVDPGTASYGFAEITGAQWSPDGSRISFTATLAARPGVHSVYVVDAEGSNLRPLSTVEAGRVFDEGNQAWSPDGSKIALQRWEQLGDGSQGLNPIAVVDVASGSVRSVGPTSPNGFVSWAWSPDGKSILEVPMDDSGALLQVDVASGTATPVPWTVRSVANWQRVAP